MAKTIRLSQLSHGAGCACKIRPGVLTEVLAKLPRVRNARVITGHENNEDAAVYKLDAKTAVVETLDFFTPMVDDPFVFGQVAAANAISDIYAMGAKPLFALNIVGFAANDLPLTMLSEILRGGAEKAAEAGIPVLGGHSIDDPEPKYGMAVTGLVHPKRVLKNSGARAGDVLILTKPLGSGIISTAIKRGKAKPAVAAAAIEVMTRLNRDAGEVFAQPKFGVHALTDVTGFSLLGHLLEMCRGAKLTAKLSLSQIPFIEGVGALAMADVIPGGTRANLKFVSPSVKFHPLIAEPLRYMLADAQTNGGLLAAVPRTKAKAVLHALHGRTMAAAVIGEFVKGPARVVVDA